MTDHSSDLFDRARRVIPGGVNSPVRAYGAVGGVPRFITRAHGAHVVDADGREYVDLIGSWGPMLLGHAHPGVLEAVQAAAADGTSFGAPSERELLLAEEIVARTPIEQVRLVNSGTEATMSVLRLARGVTGRNKIIKFAGCYHGHVDSLLVEAGSGIATHGHPQTPGVTDATVADTIVVGYNDRAGLAEAFAVHGDQIAAVITEAAAGNMGVVAPTEVDGENFNAYIRRLAHQHGALFISDEVMTGFRVSRQGQYGLDGVQPDLMTFGKVMGGGFPAAAFGGRADLMSALSPSGGVYQAGTLSGNPVAAAAGLATLQLATDDVYRHLEDSADRLCAAITEACTAAGLPHTIGRVGSMFSLFLTPADVTRVDDYATAKRQNTAAFAAFFHSLLDDGVFLAPSAFEAWFLSAAHDDLALSRIVEALPAAATAAFRAGGES